MPHILIANTCAKYLILWALSMLISYSWSCVKLSDFLVPISADWEWQSPRRERWRRAVERGGGGIQHMANAVNYAMISMFQPTRFYGAHTLSVFGKFTTRPAANKLSIPICAFPIEFSTTLELKTKAKIRTVCRNGNATRESKVAVSLKRQFYFIYLFLLLPQNFSH